MTACTVINPDLLESRADAGDPGADAAAGQGPDAGPELGLLLHYAFEGGGVSIRDSSARALDGKLSDLAARTDDGRFGRGLRLSGSRTPVRFVDLPDGVVAGVEDFTIAVWIRLESEDAAGRLYDIGNDLGRFMYLGPRGNGNRGVEVVSRDNARPEESLLASGFDLAPGVWTHLAVTGSGGDRTLHVDGSPVASLRDGPVILPRTLEPTGGSSWIGRSRSSADPGLDATIDEFRIYGRVLSDIEVAELAAR